MDQQEEVKKNIPRRLVGSIRVSRKVIDVLIQQASSVQILTYLALARYTDPSGSYSTAGRTAVKKALGVGDEQADRAIKSLLELTISVDSKKFPTHRLVYSATEWNKVSGDSRQSDNANFPVKYYLKQFDDENDDIEYVWFSNHLVDGYGQFKKPLRRLKRLGDVSLRLLLYMYRENAMEQYGGVPPYLCSNTYKSKDMSVRDQGYSLWHCVPEYNFLNRTMVREVLRRQKFGSRDDFCDAVDLVQDALNGLLTAGFLYEVVTVLDSSSSRDANVIYELDVKTRHGYKPKGETGLGGKTARLAGYWGKSVAEPGAKFNGTYAAFLESGARPSFAGIFRIRFRVSNPKNFTVSAAFARICEGQDEWEQVLDNLLKPFDEARNEKHA